MDREDAVWLAGLLEGEGSFMVYHAKSRRGERVQYPRVQLTMTDRDVVERAASLMGNAVHGHRRASERRKELFITKVTGARALTVMEAVKPWMGERRTEKINELQAQFGGSEA